MVFKLINIYLSKYLIPCYNNGLCLRPFCFFVAALWKSLPALRPLIHWISIFIPKSQTLKLSSLHLWRIYVAMRHFFRSKKIMNWRHASYNTGSSGESQTQNPDSLYYIVCLMLNVLPMHLFYSIDNFGLISIVAANVCRCT